MPSKFQATQRAKAVNLINSGNEVFYGAKAGKMFMTKVRDFVLTDADKNLYQPICSGVINYFKNNKISWWGGYYPTGHVLSSQIACVNHLFLLRKEKDAVLAILKSVSDDFVDVLQINTDIYEPAYIQFEAVSDTDHLNEGTITRGSNCTSIDALVYALHKNGEKWLIPIEWKYTEFYNNQNKAIEGCKENPQKCKGLERRHRYTNLINNSRILNPQNHFCYYFEPFYQLMRQTLWAEQMIIHKATERLKADNYLHIHVIPSANADLLLKNYKCSGGNMETTWKNHLVDKSKYVIVDPVKLLNMIDKLKYKSLIDYLQIRYW